jgi:hypothetical protein
MASVRMRYAPHPTLDKLRFVRKSVDEAQVTYGISDQCIGGFKEIPPRGLIAMNNGTNEKTPITLEEAKKAFGE